jgi:alkaline phosphatase
MKWLILTTLVSLVQSNPFLDGEFLDPHDKGETDYQSDLLYQAPVQEENSTFWINHGQNLLRNKVNQRINTNVAKNVIIFIGDGMGLSTQMATRVYMNDLNTELSFEKFPFSGLSKVSL